MFKRRFSNHVFTQIEGELCRRTNRLKFRAFAARFANHSAFLLPSLGVLGATFSFFGNHLRPSFAFESSFADGAQTYFIFSSANFADIFRLPDEDESLFEVSDFKIIAKKSRRKAIRAATEFGSLRVAASPRLRQSKAAISNSTARLRSCSRMTVSIASIS